MGNSLRHRFFLRRSREREETGTGLVVRLKQTVGSRPSPSTTTFKDSSSDFPNLPLLLIGLQRNLVN